MKTCREMSEKYGVQQNADTLVEKDWQIFHMEQKTKRDITRIADMGLLDDEIVGNHVSQKHVVWMKHTRYCT